MNTATISFKGKLETVMNGEQEEKWLKIPDLKRSHCDMAAFRRHPKYSAYANSDLFPSMLKRIKMEVFGHDTWIKMHSLPKGVSVDASGFLAVASFEV